MHSKKEPAIKQNIIGRDKEVAQLRTAIESDKAELIAVYVFDESVDRSHYLECVHHCRYKVLPSRQAQYVADIPGTPYPVTNSIAFQAEHAKLELCF